MILDNFIKAGWFTVPLKGTIERLPDGSKTIPQFEPNWKSIYSSARNTRTSLLASALTGKLSGIVALDCDNANTFLLFRQLDPDNLFYINSIGKPGGTIIYKYLTDIASFKVKNDYLALDFFSDGGSFYLPTENNKTKEPMHDLPELRVMPETVLALLKSLSSQPKPSKSFRSNNRLAPLLENFLSKKEYNPTLFKIITPKSFRELESYVVKGHLHPNDVPPGRGSEYLSKISAILGADVSVSLELYMLTMQTINSMWSKPLDEDRLLRTILQPMMEEKVTIDGKIVWQYDPNWEKVGFTAVGMNGSYLECFFDGSKVLHYLVNYTENYHKKFTEKRKLLSVLSSLLGRKMTELAYDKTKLLLSSCLKPEKEFGRLGETQYNLFRQTEALKILNNPKLYSTLYKRPETTIKYLETLIPDRFTRNFVLSFLKTKLTSFSYSPVVLYLIGVQGSGKDTFINLLGNLIGSQYIARPEAKQFLELSNGWILDKYFLQLDEYGNKLNSMSDKREALGRIQMYSGKEEIQVRSMRTDAFNYNHSFTIILTSNTNPLPLETQDRRMVLINTPNRLDTQPWVKEAGGIAKVIEEIYESTLDLAYWLATEVKTLSPSEYVVAPFTEDKEDLITDSLPAYKLITHYIAKNKFSKLESLFLEHKIPNFTEGWNQNRIMADKLTELYLAITEDNGKPRILSKALKDEGFNRLHTTQQGKNIFYYQVDNLSKYEIKPPFDIIDC